MKNGHKEVIDAWAIPDKQKLRWTQNYLKKLPSNSTDGAKSTNSIPMKSSIKNSTKQAQATKLVTQLKVVGAVNLAVSGIK